MVYVNNKMYDLYINSWKNKKEENCIWWMGEWWSWNKINCLALDCEKKLSKAGFKKGQRIGFMLPNSPIVIALSLATWKLGGTVAPMNPKAGMENLVPTLELLDLSTVFVFAEKKELFLPIEKMLQIPVIPTSFTEIEETIRLRDAKEENNDDIAVIFSTSGTSGLPKSVPCTSENIISNIDDALSVATDFIQEDTVFLNLLPNFHSLGFNTSSILPLLKGVKQAIVPTFIPVEKTIETIKMARVTAIIAVPTVLSFLTGTLAKRGEKIKHISRIVSGGDKLATSLDARCCEYLRTGVLEGYGLTECSPIVAFNSSVEKRKLGTVGPLFPSLKMEIRDRAGRLKDKQEEGVLWIKGPSVVKSYFRDEANTKERFKNGWFNTGDVVRIDSDGYIEIIDRATDIIIVGGFNVFPKEVETVLCKHPAVKSAVVVGEKNSLAGEIVKAFIILNDDAKIQPKELIDYSKKTLAHYKVPRKIAFVSEYPLSPAGKILRRVLRVTKI